WSSDVCSSDLPNTRITGHMSSCAPCAGDDDVRRFAGWGNLTRRLRHSWGGADDLRASRNPCGPARTASADGAVDHLGGDRLALRGDLDVMGGAALGLGGDLGLDEADLGTALVERLDPA